MKEDALERIQNHLTYIRSRLTKCPPDAQPPEISPVGHGATSSDKPVNRLMAFLSTMALFWKH